MLRTRKTNDKEGEKKDTNRQLHTGQRGKGPERTLKRTQGFAKLVQ